ncbi:hypothetical protein [Sulfurospirillum oryzae]|uniref:hypothetical protein n=1 Tax=Sulfurospirillum oryzae TaxID=2976535 RepID=UPI0021E8F713|nr:hypothetical protein [Sulfurospirillum oryzae]
MSEDNYIKKIKCDIADKKAQLAGLEELLDEENISDSDRYSRTQEIRRLGVEIQNLEVQLQKMIRKTINTKGVKMDVTTSATSSLINKVVLWTTQKLIKFLLRNKVQDSGNLNLGKVSEQGVVENFLLTCTRDNLKVGDLQGYFRNYALENIPADYLFPTKENEGAKKFIINSTRISTFFTFTDGENILLFDRVNANIQNVINNHFDCFGSVDFENSSLSKKIINYSFFNTNIEKIDYIPGFAFEDNLNTSDGVYPFQTVIMFGFVFYISKEDLNLAVTNGSNVFLKNVDTINTENTTSKAKLAIEFLRAKRKCSNDSQTL